MDSASLSAAFTGFAVITAAALTSGLTYLLTKKREHEADWRRLKLERYSEYVAALSGVIQGRDVTSAAQARYADAVNTLTLVAPADVLAALYEFQDEISYRNPERDVAKHDKLLNKLIRSLRHDIYPEIDRSARAVSVHMLSVPPLDEGRS